MLANTCGEFVIEILRDGKVYETRTVNALNVECFNELLNDSTGELTSNFHLCLFKSMDKYFTNGKTMVENYEQEYNLLKSDINRESIWKRLNMLDKVDKAIKANDFVKLNVTPNVYNLRDNRFFKGKFSARQKFINVVLERNSAISPNDSTFSNQILNRFYFKSEIFNTDETFDSMSIVFESARNKIFNFSAIGLSAKAIDNGRISQTPILVKAGDTISVRYSLVMNFPSYSLSTFGDGLKNRTYRQERKPNPNWVMNFIGIPLYVIGQPLTAHVNNVYGFNTIFFNKTQITILTADTNVNLMNKVSELVTNPESSIAKIKIAETLILLMDKESAQWRELGAIVSIKKVVEEKYSIVSLENNLETIIQKNNDNTIDVEYRFTLDQDKFNELKLDENMANYRKKGDKMHHQVIIPTGLFTIHSLMETTPADTSTSTFRWGVALKLAFPEQL